MTVGNGNARACRCTLALLVEAAGQEVETCIALLDARVILNALSVVSVENVGGKTLCRGHLLLLKHIKRRHLRLLVHAIARFQVPLYQELVLHIVLVGQCQWAWMLVVPFKLVTLWLV